MRTTARRKPAVAHIDPGHAGPKSQQRDDAPDEPAKDRKNDAKFSVRLIERAMDLLECLEKKRTPMGVRALEEATGIPKATGQRLLDAFEKRGYVQKDRGRYLLAAGVLRLARSYLAGDSMIAAAVPVLQELAATCGETCALYVRQDFDRILVQSVESPHPLRHKTPIGERLPLHLGASGQILCMSMPKELLEHYLDTVVPARLASGKILRKKELLARYEQAHLRGYATATDERFAGISAVAAPIVHSRRGVVAALNIAGPSSRMMEQLEQLSLIVRSAAREVSEKIDRL